MQLAGLSFMSAPQVTGHPLALPDTPDKKPLIPEVKPILDARRPETQLGTNSPRSFYYAVQNKPDPVTHNPPPSIMQIKISQMLQDQVVPTKEDVAAKAAQEGTPAKEQAETVKGTPEAAETKDPDTSSLGVSAEAETSKAGTTEKTSTEFAIEKAPALPERAPMTLPVRAVDPNSAQAINASKAPAAYEEAASFARRDVLSTVQASARNT